MLEAPGVRDVPTVAGTGDVSGSPSPLAELVARGARQLREAGLSAPRREAWQLWADLHELSAAAAVWSRGDMTADPAVSAEFLARVARRAAGEPRAYVSGFAGFRRLVLATDRRALIPRPETEGLIDRLLARVSTGRAADIGTGTGCLALSLATEGAFEEVVAVDRSTEALALARVNVRRVMSGSAEGSGERCGSEHVDSGDNGGGDRAEASPGGKERSQRSGKAPGHRHHPVAVRLVHGDLTRPLGIGAMDAIVANPPYLTEREYAAVDVSVRAFEPAEALVGGADGLEATTALLDDARRVLRPGGWLAVEVDCTRAAETARRAGQLGWRDVTIDTDLFGRERYLLARRSDMS